MKSHENTCKLATFRYPLVFLQACRRGDLRLIKSLIKNHVNYLGQLNVKVRELDVLHVQDLNGAGVFHYAAQGNQIPVLRFFHPFVLNAPVPPRSADESTPAHYAAIVGNLRAVQWVLRNTACKLLDKDVYGNNILHVAAKKLDAKSLLSAVRVNSKWLRIIKSDWVLRQRVRRYLRQLRTGWKRILLKCSSRPSHQAPPAPAVPVQRNDRNRNRQRRPAVGPGRTPVVHPSVPNFGRNLVLPAEAAAPRYKTSTAGPVKSSLKVKRQWDLLASRPSRMR